MCTLRVRLVAMGCHIRHDVLRIPLGHLAQPLSAGPVKPDQQLNFGRYSWVVGTVGGNGSGRNTVRVLDTHVLTTRSSRDLIVKTDQAPSVKLAETGGVSKADYF